MLAVLEVTQRVPPTCIIKTDFTYHFVDRSGCRRGKKDCHCDCAAFDVGSSMKFATDVCSRHSTKHLHHRLSKKNRIVEKDKSVQNRMVKTYQCQKYKYTFLTHPHQRTTTTQRYHGAIGPQRTVTSVQQSTLKINHIEKRLVLILLVLVFPHQINIKKNTCSDHFNRQSDPSLSFQSVVGTGSYTTSTTNTCTIKTSRT